MLFNSFGYLLAFLPAVLLAVFAARRWSGPRAAQAVVLVASAVFYGWSRPANLLYLAASVGVNWAIGRRVAAGSRAGEPVRKRWLQLGLVLNAVYLSSFKYVNFLLGTLPFMHGQHLIPDLEFPLGISFFTLTQIMYLVDAYQGVNEAAGLFDYATFVSFFPYVLSGPLAKAKRIFHQYGTIGGEPGKRAQHLSRGLYLFSFGLFKKAVFAGAFASIADFGFDAKLHRSPLEVLLYGFAYAMQLYFDFSGYSDMAIGSAEMLGIEIPRNFDAPFRSKSVTEFWQRWHISLSQFITSYLYTPMLRSFRKPTLNIALLCTVLAMLIAGLWHGPSWTFVIFGLLHGVALAFNQWWRKKVKVHVAGWLSNALVLLFVTFAFLFFRAPTLAQALHMVAELVSPHGLLSMPDLQELHAKFLLPVNGPPVVLGLLAAFLGRSSEQAAREFKPTLRTALLSAALLFVACIYLNSQISASFIYFKF